MEWSIGLIRPSQTHLEFIYMIKSQLHFYRRNIWGNYKIGWISPENLQQNLPSDLPYIILQPEEILIGWS